MSDLPRFEKGMTVRIKDNGLKASNRLCGMNEEKRLYAGKLKVIKDIEYNQKSIKVFRDPDAIEKYRKGRDYWTFSIEDVEPALDVNELEKEKTVEHLFDPAQLIV